MTFFETLEKASNTDLTMCMGIDPTPALLAAWGLEDTADGAKTFALTMLEAAQNNVSVVKPQIAYFE
ncbi:MAG: orotidine 5'-phosphate decarboxylase, partial [Rhizobiales bacterium]|nr:orotidine 5'-phosphate decarboxylase [Hyphomicrobiales bacterium]